MPEPQKLFMLTAEIDQGDNVLRFANVYEDFSKLKEAYFKFKNKVEVKTWLLTPVEEKEDLVIAKVNGQYVACFGPKRPITKEDTKFIKVISQEIKVKN